MTAERDSMTLNEVSVPALGVEERSDEAPTRAQLCRGRKFAPGHTRVTARERIQSSRLTAHVLARVTDATKSPLTLLDTNVVDGLSRMAQRGAGPCGLPIQVSGANDVIALLGRFWEPHDFASKVLSDNDPDD